VHSLRRWLWSACSFCGTQTACFLEFPIPHSYCFVSWWFCMILGLKTMLHCYNWLGFSELQDTKRFLFAWKCHVSTLLPPSGEMGNWAMAQDTRRKLDYLLFSLTCSNPLWVSLSLNYRPPKSWRNLWNTMYNVLCEMLNFLVFISPLSCLVRVHKCILQKKLCRISGSGTRITAVNYCTQCQTYR
jgi:hypothetical protein